ncbi:THAP domain-containing protein 5-like [Anguilla rostrata]|uniref:THAP domain-containing protein 5-like n=1 Tax=Anguilla rostrata TaxID=7938 RepID=UPI0030D0C27E
MAPTTNGVKDKLMSRLTLGSSCCAVGCNLTSGTNAISKIKMFRFPKEDGRRRAWITAVRREAWQPGKNSRICSTHFVSGAPSVDPCHPDYVPSMFAHKNTIDGAQKLERYQRRQSRPSVVESIESPSIEVTHADPEDGCTAVGTDLSMADIDQLQNENIELKRRVALLEKKLESQEKRQQDQMISSLSDFILSDDKRTHFYTGLPSASVFFTLLTYLTTTWNASSTILTLPEQFLVVLMKLRLGLTHQDLAFRFRVSCGTVSNIFHEWLEVMAKELQCLVRWPSRKYIRRKYSRLQVSNMLDI